MPFTVDDLVASFNSGGHIGQEAIDIANLQAQLSQTLAYAQQQQQQQHTSATHGLCNTPTARTPTTSFANWSAFEQHRVRSRSSSSAESMSSDDCMMDADDELAVEQLLSPTQVQPTPKRSRGRSDAFYAQQNYTYSHPSSPSHSKYSYAAAEPIMMSDCASPVSSNFAASDPFFAAASAEAQARQNQAFQQSQSSFFAQIGRPSQHSPFYAAAQSGSGGPPQTQFGGARLVPAGTVDS